jgi:hypothetical protein
MEYNNSLWLERITELQQGMGPKPPKSDGGIYVVAEMSGIGIISLW